MYTTDRKLSRILLQPQPLPQQSELPKTRVQSLQLLLHQAAETFRTPQHDLYKQQCSKKYGRSQTQRDVKRFVVQQNHQNSNPIRMVFQFPMQHTFQPHRQPSDLSSSCLVCCDHFCHARGGRNTTPDMCRSWRKMLA